MSGTGFYMAPLEGVGGTVFRNAVFKVFGDCVDKYIAPFIVPHSKKSMTNRELRELAPENNKDIYLVPQILTKYADNFIGTAEKLIEMGYREIDLNLGCPSSTVISKGRGSGMLKNKEAVDELLYGIFEKDICDISVKTRIGFEDPNEFPALLEIFNKYEMKELIIHPRVGKQMYSGIPDMKAFEYAMKHSKNPLCYNGDINTPEDFRELSEKLSGSGEKGEFPGIVHAVMIGRGMVRDPSLIRTLKGGKAASRKEMSDFMKLLIDGYEKTPMDGNQVLAKLKEVWGFMGNAYGCGRKEYKAMMKSTSPERFMENFETVNSLHNGDF